MNEMLPQILAELNLQPGQHQRARVREYYLEIRRPVQEEAVIDDNVMREPWVELPRAAKVATLCARPGQLPLPDPPVILPEEGSDP